MPVGHEVQDSTFEGRSNTLQLAYLGNLRTIRTLVVSQPAKKATYCFNSVALITVSLPANAAVAELPCADVAPVIKSPLE